MCFFLGISGSNLQYWRTPSTRNPSTRHHRRPIHLQGVVSCVAQYSYSCQSIDKSMALFKGSVVYWRALHLASTFVMVQWDCRWPSHVPGFQRLATSLLYKYLLIYLTLVTSELTRSGGSRFMRLETVANRRYASTLRYMIYIGSGVLRKTSSICYFKGFLPTIAP